MVKYIVVTGGVISGVGKGIIASSTGVLMKALGLKVTAIKIDPYLNIDAGTLSPYDHGEVFILDDGGEVDLDLGNYERFLDVTLSKEHNITTGKIYQQVIEKERRGDYLGKTVMVVPHICDAIQDWIDRVSRIATDDSGEEPDICIVELGGTVGDIESAPFIEALRQFQFRVGLANFMLIHVSLVPMVGSVGEQKTKPTQASVRDLRGLGLSPDVIACRSSTALLPEIKEKISMFCHVPPEQVIAVHDCKSVYHVPMLLQEQGLGTFIQKRLGLEQVSYSNLPVDTKYFEGWRQLVKAHEELGKEVQIALVGKYTYLQDSYISVTKALNHAALHLKLRLKINWIEATDLEQGSEEAWSLLKQSQGLLVPGGFGERGCEGKMMAIKHARDTKIPFLGLCLGFQLAVVEYARTILNWPDAHSTEMNPNTSHPVVMFMPEGSTTRMGGTMRLGGRASKFVTSVCHSRSLYDRFKLIDANDCVHERHRHRYEVNPEMISLLEAAGDMRFVAKDAETGNRMEIMELSTSVHPFFVGTQAHPEFLSRPLHPSPLFVGFLEAAANENSN